MKMREQHIVPLAAQAVQILRALDPVTNDRVPGRGVRVVIPG
jgi:hypothetical protein